MREKRLFLRKITLKIIFFSTKFCFHAHEKRRPQDVSIALDFLAQETQVSHAHAKRSSTRAATTYVYNKKIDGQFVNCDIVQCLFDSIKSIVSKIRQSHKQINLSKQLFSYSPTRFSGAFAMLNVFLEIFAEINHVVDQQSLTDYSLIDQDVLSNVCSFLLSFNTVIQALSGDQRPTLHRVLPFKQYLINKCEIVVAGDGYIKQIKSFLSMICTMD